MKDSKILVCIPKGKIFDSFFSAAHISRLNELGDVTWNHSTHQFTEKELSHHIKDSTICITGWDSPSFTPPILSSAAHLKLIAHNAGSVRPVVTDEVYEHGIRVCCGNHVFAKSVAEGVLTYILSALRKVSWYEKEVQNGRWPSPSHTRGLTSRIIGLTGFGMITEYLIQFLRPFKCKILVASSHLSAEQARQLNITLATMDEIFKTCDIVSLHNALTPDTYHRITRDLLERLKPGALFVNTARGALIDEAILCDVLAARPDITAVLDVFETEPLPASSLLRTLSNATLMSHTAGPTMDRRFAVTSAIIDDIENFVCGRPMVSEISPARAKTMTTIIKQPKK